VKRIGLLLGIFMIGSILFACDSKVVPIEKPLSPEALTQVAAKEPWQVKWDKTLEVSGKEGKVVLYASTGAAAAREMLIKNMREKYGLDLEVVTGRGAEMNQKLFSERKAGLYLADIYIGGPTTIITEFIPAGIFDPVEEVLILPEVYGPKYWRGNKLHFIDKGRLVIRWAANVNQPLAINTSLVRVEEMTSYTDLLNPKWKGKIMMNDPSATGNGQDFFYFVGMKMMGLDFMRQLAKQEPVILRDQRLLVEWLANGKYAIATGSLPDPVLQYRSEGAPVMLLNYMKEGGYISGGAVQIGLMNKAPHLNASTVFINWLLSREGQMSWSAVQSDSSLRTDIPTDNLYPGKIPDPSKKYIEEDEDGLKEKGKTPALAREIFNIK